ncbi:MAG TPA: SdrD B-like domain-containing protein, partial [Saprospiraceae bacterium]|nr:SdrD B-like domain-containing protein [Saprospiraceae bacterium]
MRKANTNRANSISSIFRNLSCHIANLLSICIFAFKNLYSKLQRMLSGFKREHSLLFRNAIISKVFLLTIILAGVSTAQIVVSHFDLIKSTRVFERNKLKAKQITEKVKAYHVGIKNIGLPTSEVAASAIDNSTVATSAVSVNQKAEPLNTIETKLPVKVSSTINNNISISSKTKINESTQNLAVVLPPDCTCTATCQPGQLGGLVWEDYNSDGVKSSAERYGVAGITVTAFDCNGVKYPSVNTSTCGYYTIPNIAANKYPLRLEFSNIPANYNQSSTFNGADSRTTVQRITAPTCSANLGLTDPQEYCQNNPKVAIPMYINGNPDITVNGAYCLGSSAKPAGLADAIVGFASNTTGSYPTPAYTKYARASQTGACWGLAYQKQSGLLFSSAVIRRHMGEGPQGLGGIYITDTKSASALPTSNFVKVSTLGINTGNDATFTNILRGLPGERTCPNPDGLGYANVGKMGIGDLDISDDGTKLFFVNLNDGKVYALNISVPATAGSPTLYGSWTVPNACSNSGDKRPWALKYYKGKLYVGSVCSAESTQNAANLTATVYEINPASPGSTPTQVLQFPLTYNKGFTDQQCPNNNKWNPWTNTFPTPCSGNYIIYPQPIFSDIEFDVNGDMILGFLDRTGFQTGDENISPRPDGTQPNQLFNGIAGGDLLRAQYNGAGQQWTLESNANVSCKTTTGVGNNQGPGGGEYYWGDYSLNDQGANTPYHKDATQGGIAMLPADGKLITNGIDPETTIWSGGVWRVDNATGGREMGYNVFLKDPGTFGKASGLGDIEAFCDLPPVQVGNYVWIDTDKDGVQDPCESPLANVNVKIYTTAGVLVATKTTDANGEYYFSTSDGLNPNTNYYIAVGSGQFANGQLTVNSTAYALTVANTGEGTSPDINDSDGTIAGAGVTPNSIFQGLPYTAAATGTYGSTNHTYDFGFTLPYCNLTCPPDKTIACTESTLPANTGNPTVNSSNTNYSLTYSDATAGTCPKTITRTWSLDCGGSNCNNLLVQYDGNCSTTNRTFDYSNVATCISTCTKLGGANGTSNISCSNSSGQGILCFESTVNYLFYKLTAGQTFTLSNIYGEYLYPVNSSVAGTPNNSTCPGTFNFKLEIYKNNVLIYTLPSSVVKDVITPITLSLPSPLIFNTGEVLEVRIKGLPSGAGCDLFEIAGMKVYGCCGGASPITCIQKITVTDNVNPAFLTFPSDLTTECNAVPNVGTPTGNDNCDPSPVITYIGEVKTNGSCNYNYTLTRSWKIKDNCGNTTTKAQIITVKDNTKPDFTSFPANVTVECSAIPAKGTPTATDNCDNAPVITYLGETKTNGSCIESYTLTRSWKVQDICGNSISKSQTITVQDTQKPSFSNFPADVTVECSAIPNVGTPTGTDNCATPTITYLGETKATGSCGGNYVLTRKWKVEDNCGNSTSKSQTITVKDTQNPVFGNFPVDVTVECDAIPAKGTPTVTDNCDGAATITYLGETNTAGSCSENYTLTRTWKAVDNCGNSTTKSQKITVKDTQKPSFTSFPADLTIECSAIPSVGTPTASDNCDNVPVITYLGETKTNGTCAGNYVLSRKWKVEDNCGNTLTKTQTITVKDNTKPVFTYCPVDVTVECDAVPNPGTPTVTDNCDTQVDITYAQVRTDGACTDSYILKRTWTATDDCGNTAQCTQVITVRDTKAPVFAGCPANVTVECDAVPAKGTPTATDNCDAVVDITYNQVRTDGTCTDSYTLTRTWIATDNCGNTSKCIQVITVRDTKAPVFAGCPANVTVECDAVPAKGTPTATDNCDAVVDITYAQVRTDGTCTDSYTLIRTWTATDNCGNSSQCTQVITVRDTKAPVFAGCPANVTVECDAVPAKGTP